MTPDQTQVQPTAEPSGLGPVTVEEVLGELDRLTAYIGNEQKGRTRMVGIARLLVARDLAARLRAGSAPLVPPVSYQTAPSVSSDGGSDTGVALLAAILAEVASAADDLERPTGHEGNRARQAAERLRGIVERYRSTSAAAPGLNPTAPGLETGAASSGGLASPKDAVDAGGWRPIATAPREGQFLVTIWDEDDDHYECIELVQGPFLSDGRIYNVNSGNLSRTGAWTLWHPAPPPPAISEEQRP